MIECNDSNLFKFEAAIDSKAEFGPFELAI